MSGNRAYFSYAENLARQIRMWEGAGLDIVYATADMQPSDAPDAICRIVPIEISDFIDTLPANQRLKHYTYWRLPAFEKVCQHYSRVLYLDLDTYCAAPGVGDLLQIDMQSATLAAVLDVHQYYRPKRIVEEFETVGFAQNSYFNAGVLLVDAEGWRREHRYEQIVATAQEHGAALCRHDQSLLNLVFYRDWLEVSPVWNWQYSKRNALWVPFAGPRLLHYAGAEKIWKDSVSSVDHGHWLSFAPQRAAEARLRDWSTTQKHQWDALVASLYYRKPFLRYLARFATDFTSHSHRTAS
ncbi:glycosyltransferase [Shimia sp.]|uniref:glycosyltransferase n=1 Tax=Shimia sp. TaxID=1954381 RepID=UPI003B8B05DC